MCVYRSDYDSSVEIQQKQIVSKQKLIYSWGIGYKKKKKKKKKKMMASISATKLEMEQ